MHRQASFVPAFFPVGVEFGTDVDFFYFPAYAEKDLGNPVLGGGTRLCAVAAERLTAGSGAVSLTVFLTFIVF